MTTLNTKNGQLLLKDGALQTDCNCCGGWYCCADNQCATDSLSSVEVSIAASNFLAHRRRLYRDVGVTLYESSGFGGESISGTHSLSRSNNTPYSVDAYNGNAYAPKNASTEWVAIVGYSAFQCRIQLSGSKYGGNVFRWSLLLDFSTTVYATDSPSYKGLDYLGGISALTFSPNPYTPSSPSTYERRRTNFQFFFNTIDQCGVFAPLLNAPAAAQEAGVIWEPTGPSLGSPVVATDYLHGSLLFSVSVSFS